MVDTSHYVPDYMVAIDGVDLNKHTEFSAILGGRPIDITSVAITETVNDPDTFTIALRSRHKELERFPSGAELTWIDDDSLKVGQEVAIALGYVGNLAIRLLGKITATSIGFAESGLITVKVEGKSLYVDLLMQRNLQAYANKPDSAIASAIAGGMNLDPHVDPTTVQHATVSSPQDNLAEILRKRAERLYYELKVKQRTLCFQKPRYLVDLSPTLTLVWGQDLLSFNPRIKTSGIVTRVVARNVATALGRDRKPLVGVADAGSVPPRLGKCSGAQMVQEAWQKSEILSDDQQISTPEEAQDVAVAQYRRAAIDFVEADGATIGEPQLVSQSVIQLLGLGKRLSGLYYVTSTTHTIDANGYRTTFHAKRDALCT
jgi:uncharacterized protein